MLTLLIGFLGCEQADKGFEWDDSEVDEEGDTAEGGLESGEIIDHESDYPGTKVEADCVGAPGSYWYVAEAPDRAVRMISVTRALPEQDVHVVVEEDTPLTLILMSEEAVNWVVDQAVTGTVERILLISVAEGSTVDAPSTASVETLSDGATWPVGYSWYDPQVQASVEAVEALLETPLDSFHGCYDENEFRVVATVETLDTSEHPDCDDSESWSAWEDPDLTLLDERCPELSEDETVCLATTHYQVLAIGLESADVCTVTDYVANGATLAASGTLALSGRDLYLCAYAYGELTRISLEEGSVDYTLSWCTGLAWHAEERSLLLASKVGDAESWHLRTLEGWEQATCEGPEDTEGFIGGPPEMVVADDVLLWAESRGDTVYRTDLVTGETDAGLTLEGDATQIYAMSASEGGEKLVVYDVNRLLVFDAGDGSLEKRISLGETEDITGLQCFDRD